VKRLNSKPSFYAFFIQALKEEAAYFGYNLVVHGSMNRDMDLILIPWDQKLGDLDQLLDKMAQIVGGKRLIEEGKNAHKIYHWRKSYVININRGGPWNDYEDEQFYIDISVLPAEPDAAEWIRGLLRVNFVGPINRSDYPIWTEEQFKEKSITTLVAEAFSFFDKKLKSQ